MNFRSILFVPGDRPDRFEKAMTSAADALILDLEDSVSLTNKETARQAVCEFSEQEHEKPVFVRINPIQSEFYLKDLDVLLSANPDGVVLPKAEGAKDVDRLVLDMGSINLPILPITTETPASVFELATYKQVSEHMCGLTWGAEDLPAAIGASSARQTDGAFTPPYEWVRAQALFAAHAADVMAIETVFPDIKNTDELSAYTQRGRRDGFNAMMAIHPSQCEIINAAFTPSEQELNWARSVVEAFTRDPDAGVLQIEGKMVDAPHLKQAQKLLSRDQNL